MADDLSTAAHSSFIDHMSKKSQKRGHASAPISLRLSPDERKQLMAAAKGQTLSAHIRSRLFNVTPEPIELKEPGRLSAYTRQQLLARILAELGRSRMSKSLGDMAEAARIGVLPVTPDVLAEIREACTQIQGMRQMLVRSLGLSPREDR